MLSERGRIVAMQQSRVSSLEGASQNLGLNRLYFGVVKWIGRLDASVAATGLTDVIASNFVNINGSGKPHRQ
jgi:hypothetical protein